MLTTLLVSLYITNAVLLTVNEMECASWNRIVQFGLPRNLAGFLIFHFPLLLIMSFGFLELSRQTSTGYSISALLAFGGILLYFLNMFLKKELSSSSRTMVNIIAVVSVVQLALSLSVL